MYSLVFTSKFKKDLKKIKGRKADFQLVVDVLRTLEKSGVKGISKSLRPHKLSENYKGWVSFEFVLSLLKAVKFSSWVCIHIH